MCWLAVAPDRLCSGCGDALTPQAKPGEKKFQPCWGGTDESQCPFHVEITVFGCDRCPSTVWSAKKPCSNQHVLNDVIRAWRVVGSSTTHTHAE
ncbi:hypothetical protein PGT21_025346 [Puccinia graminis f. sp. tritici]|nr:hypothetical protein PGT21_025346 [Puccinia graminis f. sp. tritici]KAA1123456.1 hypothetical protein PGTUg99_013311 [Puccinia graminis f. sp. tritici]